MMRALFALPVILAFVSTGFSAELTSATVHPFNGKDTSGWKLKGDAANSRWQVGTATLSKENNGQLVVSAAESPEKAELINAKMGSGGIDIFTEEKFGDCLIKLELMVPKGSNSGVYVMGEYEVQVLDSFGKPDNQLSQGDLGALYSAAKPAKNVAKAPGEWQQLEIDFQAPEFEGDKKVSPAKFVKVTLNGQVLHENVEMKGPTPGGLAGKEAASGPLMIQGDHGPVAFRKIEIIKK